MLWRAMSRAASKLIILALLGAAAVFGSFVNDLKTLSNPNETSQMAATLRRQLMVNNYDYVSSETEELPERYDEAAVPAGAPPLEPRWGAPPHAGVPPPPRGLPEPPDLVNEIFIDRTHDASAALVVESDPASPPGGDSDGIGKKDMLYYSDDERLKKLSRETDEGRADYANAMYEFETMSTKKKFKVRKRSRETDEAGADYPADPNSMNEFETTSPKVKYKVLKVHAAGGAASRRSGGGAPYRRLLQEEGADGVAIINLDGEPFPQFRLPSARRQYMSDAEADRAADLVVAEMTDFSDQMINGFDEAMYPERASDNVTPHTV